MKPKVIEKQSVYRGRVFDVDVVTLDDDGLVYKREIISHGGSAVVLPMHSDGGITLVRQYRHPAGTELLEIPAGTVEDGESPIECAARELAEETGYKAGKITPLSEFFVSPGFLTEKMHLFLATVLSETESHPDFDEKIETVRIKRDLALEMIRDGSISDAKTIIGIMLALNSPKQR